MKPVDAAALLFAISCLILIWMKQQQAWGGLVTIIAAYVIKKKNDRTAKKDDDVTVLIVDDDSSYGYLIDIQLSKCDAAKFITMQADCIATAVELIKDRTFSIILCDLGLPNGRGVSSLSRLSVASGDTPMVVITGREENAAELEVLRRHCDEVLYKDKIELRFLGSILLGVISHKRPLGKAKKRNDGKSWLKSAAEFVGGALRTWFGPKE